VHLSTTQPATRLSLSAVRALEVTILRVNNPREQLGAVQVTVETTSGPIVLGTISLRQSTLPARTLLPIPNAMRDALAQSGRLTLVVTLIPVSSDDSLVEPLQIDLELRELDTIPQ